MPNAYNPTNNIRKNLLTSDRHYLKGPAYPDRIGYGGNYKRYNSYCFAVTYSVIIVSHIGYIGYTKVYG